MIKLNHVTSIAVATLVVLAVAAFMAYRQVALARDSYRAEVAMQETLANVRQLQIATRALQSERADFDAIRHDWAQARDSFPRQLQVLDASLTAILPNQPQLRRITDTWDRMETAHGQVNLVLTHLKEAGVQAQIGTRSLVLSYQEMLQQRGTPDAVLGEIGLLLFQLEQTDRMVLEIEFELRDLARNLGVRTSSTVRNSLTAVAVVLGIATVFVVGLLIR
ncbi:MAG: hypothetical protein SF070_09690, partial [Gemmatimonadota bacterium]|nr:hypothetical protein [Gemmatimonadota bacterium]